MSTTGIVLGAIGVLLSLGWVLVPLFRRQASLTDETVLMQKQQEHLMVHYEQVLRTLRDLDEDFQTGKLAQDVYETSREEWVQTGTQVLQALDNMPQIKFQTEKTLSEDELDDRIEAEIASYLAKAGSV